MLEASVSKDALRLDFNRETSYGGKEPWFTTSHSSYGLGDVVIFTEGHMDAVVAEINRAVKASKGE